MTWLQPLIAKAPWIADDIRSEAVLCEIEGLSDHETHKRLRKMVFKERAIRVAEINLDELVLMTTSDVRANVARKLTRKQSAAFYRPICIQICEIVGVPVRTLGVVHDVAHSRIAAICHEDLHAKLAKLQGDE